MIRAKKSSPRRIFEGAIGSHPWMKTYGEDWLCFAHVFFYVILIWIVFVELFKFPCFDMEVI